MGYNSYLSDISFVTDCKSQKEVDDKVNRILNSKEMEKHKYDLDCLLKEHPKTHPIIRKDLLFTFNFVELNRIEVVPEGEDYSGKWPDMVSMAFIVSKLIAIGDRTSFELDGEEDDRWGYAIKRDYFYQLCYRTMVNIQTGKDMDLGKWITGG